MKEEDNALPSLEAVAVLSALPVGVFIADADGKVRWVNDTLCDQLGVPRERLLGIERAALPARKTLSLSKTIHWLHAPGAGTGERRFECVTQKLEGLGDFDGSVGCVIDVSRYETARRPRQLYPELKDPGRLDPATGLLNALTMQQELVQQVARSRRYLNPLSVVIIRLQDLGPTGESVTAIQKQRLVRGIAKMLKEKLRWVDVVGCWERDAFMLILPETALEPASKLVRKIETYINRLRLEEERAGESMVAVGIGLAEWGKGDDLPALLARAERNLRGEDEDLAEHGQP
ncbi:MAG: diguanylate cyclase [Gammaproteobacteria bacterium]